MIDRDRQHRDSALDVLNWPVLDMRNPPPARDLQYEEVPADFLDPDEEAVPARSFHAFLSVVLLLVLIVPLILTIVSQIPR